MLNTSFSHHKINISTFDFFGVDMSKSFDLIEKAGEFVWFVAKGFIALILMTILTLATLFAIFYFKFSYDQAMHLRQQFDADERAVVQILPMIPAKQKTILKFRQQKSGGIYHYVLVYQLNLFQIQQVELFFDKMKKMSRPESGLIPCIYKTTDTKWLFPQISRHYIKQLDDYDSGSFLVYGSDDEIHHVENACKDDSFKIINLKTNKFNKVQIALNKSHQIMLVNFIE